MTTYGFGARLFALVLAPLWGCSGGIPNCKVPKEPKQPEPEYVLLEYRRDFSVPAAPDGGIQSTPHYRELLGKVKSVALRAPDGCLDDGGAKRCGPWIGELERSFSSAGLRVVSSDALVKLEREKKLSTYSAGKQLGADIVFVFGTLESADIAKTPSPEVRFFDSNERGDTLEPKNVDDDTKRTLLGIASPVIDRVGSASSIAAISSVVDATAIVPQSGESIWFYHKAVTQNVRKLGGMKFLLGRLEPASPWRSLTPRRQDAAKAVSASTEDEETGAAANRYNEQRLALVRSGAASFVGSFQGTKQ